MEKAITSGEIAAALSDARLVGSPMQEVRRVISLPETNEDPSLLFWCTERNWDKLRTINRGVVLCSNTLPDVYLVPGRVHILVPNPRMAFQEILSKFFSEPCEIEGVSPTAVIHSTAKIHPSAMLGANVVIERDVTIGKDCVIGHNTVLKRRSHLGEHVVIGANCTIGGVGFGYEKDSSGKYALLPHIGNVVVEDFVEIGNNTAVDRAVIGSTILRKNSKIDNLVHIAHGVEVGENSLVIANAMVAGSVVIGKNVWVAPSASVLNQKTIGDRAVIGMGAVVLKDVEEGSTVVGNPARLIGRGENK